MKMSFEPLKECVEGQIAEGNIDPFVNQETFDFLSDITKEPAKFSNPFVRQNNETK